MFSFLPRSRLAAPGWGALALALALASASGGEELEVPETLSASGERDLNALWIQAALLEREGRSLELGAPAQAIDRYLAAACLYQAIADARPELASAHWRAARSMWGAGDTLPLDAADERIARFARAEEMAARGLAADPDCAECMLWKFAAMGRLRTTRGVLIGLRQLPEMAWLLDRGIELAPDTADDEDNSTLGNLHYSSAIFYRVFPDWFWIEWVLGVRGDKERALGHIETALALHPQRVDYEIELGSQLLCLGSTRGESERLREGKRVLRRSLTREPETLDELRELDAARVMIERPEIACGYSGDTWVEIDAAKARRAAGR